MPYKVSPQKGGGFKVTSPGHPQGFSKEPQTRAQAEKQAIAIRIHARDGGGKPKK